MTPHISPQSLSLSQVDNYITRPTSCDGVPDSGVSDGSENIFHSDNDNTSLAAPQSQTVIRHTFFSSLIERRSCVIIIAFL